MQGDRPAPKLSPREQQLLRFAAEGLTDLAIAKELGISEATVGTYWGRVRIKFGPFSRTELVAIMMRSEAEAVVENMRAENEHYVRDLKIELSSGSLVSARELLDYAPDAAMLISQSGVIEYTNQAAYELFGFEKDELHGQDHDVIIPKRFSKAHTKHVHDYVNLPSRRPMGGHLRTPALTKDGAEILIRASLTAIPSQNGILVMCLIRPV